MKCASEGGPDEDDTNMVRAMEEAADIRRSECTFSRPVHAKGPVPAT